MTLWKCNSYTFLFSTICNIARNSHEDSDTSALKQTFQCFGMGKNVFRRTSEANDYGRSNLPFDELSKQRILNVGLRRFDVTSSNTMNRPNDIGLQSNFLGKTRDECPCLNVAMLWIRSKGGVVRRLTGRDIIFRESCTQSSRPFWRHNSRDDLDGTNHVRGLPRMCGGVHFCPFTAFFIREETRSRNAKTVYFANSSAIAVPFLIFETRMDHRACRHGKSWASFFSACLLRKGENR